VALEAEETRHSVRPDGCTDARKETLMGDTFTVVVIGVAAVLGGAAFGLAWGLRQGPVEQKTNRRTRSIS